ncbi:MAG: homocysteine S-methyltransferase family protein [Kiloniellaceae bacterium]
MTKYRSSLPQLSGGLFLTDGGIETTLIFHDGLDLPYFAAFDLLKDQPGREALKRYFTTHASIAKANGCGFLFESPTWRASSDWGDKLGYSETDMAKVNKQSISLLTELRETFESDRSPMVISGCVGPRGDGYSPGALMTPQEAEAYHAKQIQVFAETEADLVTAITMTNVEEAIGVTRASQAAGMPVAISFTVETDGRLPSGATLKEAIEAVDAATANGPAYFMINCAHPDHFEGAIAAGETWVERIKGLRANASRLSHAELDEAEELDDGNPEEFGQQHRALHRMLGHITVMGGCCGTDHRHIEAICHACVSEAA